MLEGIGLALEQRTIMAAMPSRPCVAASGADPGIEPQKTMIYKFCTQTDTGRIRANNEDAAVVDERTNLAVLADGMGGYNAGEIASGMATDLIKSEMSRWLSEAGHRASPREIRRAMEICVDHVNRAILNAAISNPQYAGMGTTLVLGVFQDSKLMLGHLGDSRCYRLRHGELVQITRDHSLLQEQMDAGLLTPEQAARSANKNLVTRALGVEEAGMLELNEHQVEAGDLYLMCSDGLSDMVDDGEIARLLAAPASLERRAELLVGAANQHGGRDNITVLLAQAGATMEKRGLISRWLGKWQRYIHNK